MWDNRGKKTNPKAPDFKCRDKNCTGVIWRYKAPAAQPIPGGYLEAELRGAPIAEFVQLGKMVPRVDVEQRQREFGRAKGFFSEPQ